MTVQAASGPARSGPPAALPPRRRLAMRLVAAAIVLLVSLLVAECGVRVVAPQALSGSWREPGPTGYSIHRAGVVARHQWRDRVVTYRINEQRLRGGPLEEGRFRVLVLGDSFTFGWLVEEGDTFVARLQRDADQAFGAGRVQVLNGAEGGWGTDCAVAFAEDFGDTIRPDAVLCFLNTWDVGRSLFSGVFEIEDETALTLRRGSTPQQAGGLARLVASMPGYNWLLEHSHLAQCARNVFVRSQTAGRENPLWDTGEPVAPATPGADAAQASPDLGRRAKPAGQDPERDHRARVMGKALFRRLGAWCRARDIPLWVATTGRPDMLPTDGRGTPWGHTEATLAFRQVAPEFFRGEGVPYLDLIPEVRDRCSDFRRLMISGEGHPDAEGHRVIADAAWSQLRPILEPSLIRRGR